MIRRIEVLAEKNLPNGLEIVTIKTVSFFGKESSAEVGILRGLYYWRTTGKYPSRRVVSLLNDALVRWLLREPSASKPTSVSTLFKAPKNAPVMQ